MHNIMEKVLYCHHYIMCLLVVTVAGFIYFAMRFVATVTKKK